MLVSVTTCFVTMATPMRRKLRYVSKCNKLVQLVVLVQYHVNVIYSLGGGHTHTHADMPTSQTKAISRNQARRKAGAPGLKSPIVSL